MSHDDARESFAQRYVESQRQLLARLPLDDLASIMAALEQAHREQRQVFIIGNGGSAAIASHMAADLMLTVAKGGGAGFRVVSLSDNMPAITAVANDEGYENIFAAQLRTTGEPSDLLIAISGSGNSRNILRALEMGRERGMKTIGLLGMGGGKAGPLCDLRFVVPSHDYGPIEGTHALVDHLLTAYFHAWTVRKG